ncbi:hypothetical protein [endosymbiont DhMRE of Dentiscutata heterogama]|uniref:hypothetical protein n=1 Tax=endosymbiont DhMRE of Dentiscutata heterogama TaxID=1609546 RepID=UPI002AD2010E|nr:hypothetical protein [endosymbiont DhMRE of Dentiscutata heterogama]
METKSIPERKNSRKKACWFCWVFKRPWQKNNELVMGYVLFWDIYPQTVKRPICWKCCILWQQSLKNEVGRKDMGWLNYYGESNELEI